MSDHPHLTVEAPQVPPELPVDIAIELVEKTTPDAPARIRVEVTFTGDAQRELGFGFTPPLSKYVAEQRDGGGPGERGRLVVLPVDSGHFRRFRPERPTDGCWRATGWPERLDTGTIAVCDPGRVIDREYAVLAAPDGPCFPEGTYELRDEFWFGEHGGVSIGWRFRIRVER